MDHHKNNMDGQDDKLSNILTLRGAGIGDNSKQAYYIILTEDPEVGYRIEEKLVPFVVINLGHDINLSSLSQSDKDKISDWTHSGRGR